MTGTMSAMVFRAARLPLAEEQVVIPRPGAGEVLIRVEACAVCRTDLHIVDGDLKDAKIPLIPGHEIVGKVVAAGANARRFRPGDRIGVPWLGWTCGECAYCREGRENLCDRAQFTGYHRDGGFAEYAVADERYAIRIPASYEPVDAAPFLCAGLIGYRTYRMAGAEVRRVGLYGFGAAAHLVAQIALHEGREVYAFTRPGDEDGQRFALAVGATWAGSSDQSPPAPLDAALIFAPVGALVPQALRQVRKGGTVVCGGIHMSEIPAFPYEILWGERIVRSVANLTRRDGQEFFAAAAKAGVRANVRTYPLSKANKALADLRDGRLTGAAVLIPEA